MKRRKKIIVAGGDRRQVFCAERLARVHEVKLIGTGEESRGDFFGKADCVILPVIPLDGDGNINAPFSVEKIPPEILRDYIDDGSIIFTGKRNSRLEELFPQNEIISYIEREDLSLKNAIPSAEGAVQIALAELPVTLNGLSVLIVGAGRIGTALTGILKGFGADVTIAVRSAEGAAKAKIMGVKSVCMGEEWGSFRLVFNTAPEIIFDRGRLEKFRAETLFIDLASSPGGFDKAAVSELGKRVISAPGLPGKTAPVTAGEIIAETILNILSERGE